MTCTMHRVLMIDGHFDYGNGYHGRVYLNPHAIFRQPSTFRNLICSLVTTLKRRTTTTSFR